MDITRAATQQEVAPPSWIIAQRQQDLRDVIRRAIEQQPEASVDDIVEQLRRRNVPASGIFVAREMQTYRDYSCAADPAQL
jgi:hypothetical protein